MNNYLRGVVSFSVYVLNTVFWGIPICLLGVLKLFPWPPLQRILGAIGDKFATCWVSVNNFNQRFTSNTRWQVHGTESLSAKDWYLVVANHQSWVDILVLQRVFNRKIPFLKFFLKRQLLWIPLLGLAWWALDFPFMQRYSKAYLRKHPQRKGTDLQTTKKACEKFRHIPVSIMNFAEGTRWTKEKHQRQQSPYQHLLTPRAGGMAFVLHSMGDQLHKLLDVTIHYPQGIPCFWDFICGKVTDVIVDVKVLAIEPLMPQGELDDPAERARFHRWLNQLWHDKDQRIQRLADAG